MKPVEVPKEVINYAEVSKQEDRGNRTHDSSQVDQSSLYILLFSNKSFVQKFE